ncbi:MAG: small nuclear ribonucleoprotein [Candidatus Aenigmatarchaeota archaeon]|nr:MAG: small nuclear ribonucleoprotein [Candidatus Aenigmarchaeota archaeon]
MSRPLDALENAKGKRVLVSLKDGHEVTGTLKAFDLHLNLWLEDAEKRTSDKTTKLGTVVVRGDNVLLVSPE